ncbi:MlaA family lipoprotein [Ottowia thiooxydans]|uniref:MlaA family lipoprotein n=1 Tax=Ottowia thiooxydans TaxID=219182 RepID=UPI0004028AFE|nr:VacJ family lipoprotein [Ottowia thiooxydans]
MNTQAPAWFRLSGRLAAVMLAMALVGCASAPNADPRDPWEPYNRSMTTFNDAVDDAVLKPVATAYKEVLPRPVRTGVGNFFGNLSDVWSFVNNVLQAKPEGSLHSLWRVVINTSIGIGGVFDPASEMRLERHREDFGQTLGRWGVPSGPYVVLPILGPSTLRDSVALPVDSYGQPLRHADNVRLRNSLSALGIVDVRARLLELGNILDAAALDPYTFKRDVYLQKRQSDISDGNSSANEERYDLDEGDSGTAPKAPAASPRAPRPAQGRVAR